MHLPPLKSLTPDRPLAVLDLEATGPDPATARIVEVAVARLDPAGGPPAVFCRRLDPGLPIPAAATAVHGIADHDVAGCPTFRQVAPALLRLLAGCDLVGFGIARYDLPLLAAEFGRCHLPFEVAGRRVLDALTVYHRHHPRTLAAAVRQYLGRGHAGAHAAGADAAAALAVLDAQIAAHALPADPAALHALLVPADVAGRLARDADGSLVLAAGKHRGVPLGAVARADPGYLRWLLRQPLLDDTADRVADALREPALDDLAG